MKEPLDRRGFLKQCGGAVVAAGLAAATPASAWGRGAADDLDSYDFLMPRVIFDCDRRVACPWNIYPGGDKHLLEEFSKTVRCKVKLEQPTDMYQPMTGDERHFNGVVSFRESSWFGSFPFVFMTAEGAFRAQPREVENLRQYLEEGGFILMDDCVFDRGGDFFYRSAYEMLEQAFGDGRVVRIPNDHEIFQNVFDFSSRGLPYAQGQQHGARGVFIGDRLVAFLSPSDLHCGWTDRAGKWFPRQVYSETIKMGINILTYAISH